MAASELGLKAAPCVVSTMENRSAQRLAVNLNTIHGDPNAELLAPFLAEMDESLLAEIHIEADLMTELLAFDDELKARLEELQAPGKMNRKSNAVLSKTCKCPKCGRKHISQ